MFALSSSTIGWAKLCSSFTAPPPSAVAPTNMNGTPVSWADARGAAVKPIPAIARTANAYVPALDDMEPPTADSDLTARPLSARADGRNATCCRKSLATLTNPN